MNPKFPPQIVAGARSAERLADTTAGAKKPASGQQGAKNGQYERRRTARTARAQAAQAEYKPHEYQAGKDVVWVPTSQTLVDKMLDTAKVTAGDYVIDLGSGDGRTVIAAAERGARSLGIEYNPDMVEMSKRNAARMGITLWARFVTADLFESDFSQATVITMFLLPKINLKLRPKLLELKPGTRIVSNTFDMGEWKADETVTTGDNCDPWATALFWIVPAKVEGNWKLAQGDLALDQTFQMVSGTLWSGVKSTPVNGRLRGDEISFTAGHTQYSGRVNGDKIEGTVRTGGKANNWSASRASRRADGEEKIKSMDAMYKQHNKELRRLIDRQSDEWIALLARCNNWI